MKMSIDAWVSLFAGTCYGRVGTRWHNSEDLRDKYQGEDPIEFVHNSGLSKDHFHLNYQERCYYYSQRAKNLYIKRSKL